MPNDRPPTRLLARLTAAKRAKQFYETHQLYRSLYHRLSAARQLAELQRHMEEGANFLLVHDQQESGIDLALLLLDALKRRESSDGLSQTEVRSLSRLHSLMRTDTPERCKFIENVVGHLSSDVGYQAQLLLFNELVAYNFWNAHDYPRARYHFIHSRDGFACANLLIEFHLKAGYPSEVDLFIAQAVLQLLCLDQHAQAAVCFHTYTRRHPRLDPGPPFKSCPLLNFVWFLLLATAERDKCQGAVYQVLVNAYQRHLVRDPDYTAYLQKIGELFFHQPKAKQEPSVLAGLLSSLGFGGFSGGDEGPSTSDKPSTLSAEDVD